MKFIDNIYDADGCMCDVLYNYDDIQLQAVFGLPTNNPAQSYSYTIKIAAYSLDGTLIASDLFSDFNKAFYKISGTNLAYANLVSRRISEALCDAKCFRLKAEIKATYTVSGVQMTKVVFDKYTDCMIVDNCCVRIPSGGIGFETIVPMPLPDISFYVDDDMNLIYEFEEDDKRFSFEVKDADLIVKGNSNDIAVADFKIVENEIFGTSYE